jgi:hypothetical protein
LLGLVCFGERFSSDVKVDKAQCRLN